MTQEPTYGDIVQARVATGGLLLLAVGLTALFGSATAMALLASDTEALLIATIGTLLASGGALVAWSHLQGHFLPARHQWTDDTHNNPHHVHP